MDKYIIFNHFMETFRFVGSLSKANITTGHDASVITGYSSPLFNIVQFDTKNHTKINKLKSANIPFMAMPSKKLEADFETFAQEQGLMKSDFVAASILNNLENWEYKPNSKIQIGSVSNDNDLLVFDKISAVIFGHPENLTFNFLKSALGSGEIHLFLAYAKGQPVGCGILSFANNQAGLYWDGVLPDFRNQGIATSLVKYRMNIAKNLGHTSVIAQNMTLSLRLYKRLGFEQLGGLPLYLCPKQFFIF